MMVKNILQELCTGSCSAQPVKPRKLYPQFCSFQRNVALDCILVGLSTISKTDTIFRDSYIRASVVSSTFARNSLGFVEIQLH